MSIVLGDSFGMLVDDNVDYLLGIRFERDSGA